MIKEMKIIYNAIDPDIRKAVRLLIGWIIFIFGIAALFIPIIPGTPFVILGAYMLKIKTINNFIRKIFRIEKKIEKSI